MSIDNTNLYFLLYLFKETGTAIRPPPVYQPIYFGDFVQMKQVSHELFGQLNGKHL